MYVFNDRTDNVLRGAERPYQVQCYHAICLHGREENVAAPKAGVVNRIHKLALLTLASVRRECSPQPHKACSQIVEWLRDKSRQAWARNW